MSVAYGLLGVAQTVYGLSPVHVQEKARSLVFILEWPWYYWAVLVLGTMLVAALEGAYRSIFAGQTNLVRLQEDLRTAKGGSDPKLPECMQFGSVDYRAGLKFFYFHFESPPDGAVFRVFCDRDVEGEILVGAMTESEPFHSIDTTTFDRRETSFSFLFPQEYIQAVLFVNIALQSTSARIVEIRQV